MKRAVLAGKQGNKVKAAPGRGGVSVAQRILDFHRGRDPARLSLKYQKMRNSPDAFLRGTCFLFYQSLPRVPVLAAAPVLWACGDLHLGNFGSYKGNNRLTYFDINDFDETLLAPAAWDLVRLLASLNLQAEAPPLRKKQVGPLATAFLNTYCATIAAAKAGWVERATADGAIKTLLRAVKLRVRSEFLDERTVRQGNARRLAVDGKKALPASKSQVTAVRRCIRKMAAELNRVSFFKVHDVARRIAGTGSLGVERYVVLVEGSGSPEQNFLLDLKQALPSSIASYSPGLQPAWHSEGERIVEVQSRMQAVPPALLRSVEMEGATWVVRELQPTADRVDFAAMDWSSPNLEKDLATLAQILAWAQLRSAGWRTACSEQALLSWIKADHWQKPLLVLAGECAKLCFAQWQEYCTAYDSGVFTP